MARLLPIALLGLIAQLVDGSLGMAYGATSATLLLATGMFPAVASAVVHLGELGTTLASGASHWRLGNVDWRTVRLMALPGALGAFLGAVVLSSADGDISKPWVATLLLLLGVYVLYRFLRWPYAPQNHKLLPRRFLRGLGLAAGFLDAVGGGGWGPVGTPTLLASGRMETRKVIGSIDTSEFLVALGASIGFLVSLRWDEIPLDAVAMLLLGGVVAAPLAAYLVRAVSPRKLGVLVGGTILLTNARTLALTFGLDPRPRTVLYAAIVGSVGILAFVRMLQSRNERSDLARVPNEFPRASSGRPYYIEL